MPVASTRYPSVSLGLLQAILERRGIAADTHYLNLRFAARIGWQPYEALVDSRWHLAADWLFARAAFRGCAPDGRRFLDAVADAPDILSNHGDFLLYLREREAPAFVEDCLETVAWERYDVVGFGSVHQQHTAALALARRIKERHPRITTVFGGAYFEGEMGLEFMRVAPWIDCAVIGEGDEVLPALVERLAGGGDAAGMAGVAWREGGKLRFGGRAPMVRDLDGLPEPEYRDYFATAAELEVPAEVRGRRVHLSFESARGCWYGEKHHCTFCGLNGLGMAYRSKSPARVLRGIHELAGRYGRHTFEAVDNIMDQRYIEGVFAPLAVDGAGYRFFYEVKANLTRAQLRIMAAAGVRDIQPGIESLDTHTLGLMRKGVTAIQNVRCLKWAHYHGMSVAWNILLGFPGETVEGYRRQLAIMGLIPHLPPPGVIGPFSLERFSPNHAQAEALGIRNVRPHRVYAGIYPAGIDLERIAYFFEHDTPGLPPAEAYAPLQEAGQQWRDAWQSGPRPFLDYAWDGDVLTVRDGRRPGAPREHAFAGAAAPAYELCGDTDHRLSRVLAHLREQGFAVDAATVQGILDRFVGLGLMLEEDGRYLSLALPYAADA